jgi:hypothetical protein
LICGVGRIVREGDCFAEFAVVGAKGAECPIEKVATLAGEACCWSALTASLPAELIEIGIKNHSNPSQHAATERRTLPFHKGKSFRAK